jgi:hypothetical protein
MKNKRGFTTDPIHLIVGVMAIAGGLLYLVNYGSWGLIVVTIGLLMEALRQVIK